ncbi:9 glycosyl hydrolase [Dendrothele bispora CBS 962.96]|uniref:Endoglucanase n=1 Tax=Dendrothele bispora (strain CBS 962.96) TaxID=1314807 RepID=A0A4S8MZD5_DENBC|nr:9 glycosyl hydrolase [Dendrothele bispora CBS 962.96]
MLLLIFLLAAVTQSVVSQLSLPESPWLPPDASKGAIPSNSGGTPNPQWSTLLGNLLYFYEAQRSGTLPSTNRVSWRNDSCTSDGSDVGLDLSGGYYDAGDYIKVSFPLSFTIMSICWGATDFGKGYDLANQTAYLDDMLRWGLDWLIKMHPSNDTLYIEVADTGIDNAYWGGDQNIPGPRPSYQINDTHPGTDAAASVSAAFSSCSNLYAGRGFNAAQAYQPPASLQNSSYADTLLRHAQQLYSFAVNASGGQVTYQTSTPIATESYASSGFGDDLAIAALFLAAATNSSSYYQDANSFYQKFNLHGQNAVFNWDSKTPGVYVLFAQLAQANYPFASDLSSWQTESERYFDTIVNDNGDSSLTNGGLLFYDGDSDDASLNPALNAAMLLTRYAAIASSPDKTTSYLNYASRQLDYALGKNPMSVPYVVGVNPNSPSNPHSAMASGGDDIGNIDTVPEKEAYVLYGAVIGGPDKRDRFFDIRSDWPETEVALDYNAPMLTLAAMHVLNDTNDPFYTSLQDGAYAQVKPQGSPCDDAIDDGCSGPRLSTGAKVAIAVVVTVVGLIILGLLAWYIWTVRGNRKAKTG